MNRERAKELLPIIKAFSEGKTIQYQQFGMTAWLDITPGQDETFTDKGRYRIKPEPRDFWVCGANCFRSERDAMTYTGEQCEIIHVREVLE